jgi:hypothetical protein
MSDNWEQIKEERLRVAVLDSSLETNRTPYLKSQLGIAFHLLDDAMDALLISDKADPKNTAMWLEFAQLNIQTAVQIRQKAQGIVAAYGGPENVVEVS